MKTKILFVFAIVAMLLVGQEVSAQMKLGGSLVLGTKLSIDDDLSEGAAFGIGVKGLYELNESFSIAPGFTYFFPSSPKGIDLTEYVLDVDAHYNFVKEETLKVYGIGGLNYSYVDASIDFGEFGTFSGSDSKLGLNFGVGARTGGDMQFFGDLKYNTAYENINLAVGVLFNL
jgi:opacity protein-like surface antigen